MTLQATALVLRQICLNDRKLFHEICANVPSGTPLGPPPFRVRKNISIVFRTLIEYLGIALFSNHQRQFVN